MHIVTGPNGLVESATKPVCACVCLYWTSHSSVCYTDYCANTGKREMEQGMDRAINGLRWKERDDDEEDGRREGERVGRVVEQIETDTHPQQEWLTPSRKHTQTHTQRNMYTANTQSDIHTRTHQKHFCTHAHTHRKDGEFCISHSLMLTHTHAVWAGCGHSRCCPWIF